MADTHSIISQSMPVKTNHMLSATSDAASFFRNMEQRQAALHHQRSMIEVPQGIYDLQHEFPNHDEKDEDDDEDDEDEYTFEDHFLDGVAEPDELDLDEEIDPEEMKRAIGKKDDIDMSDDDEDDDDDDDYDQDEQSFSDQLNSPHARQRSGAQIIDPSKIFNESEIEIQTKNNNKKPNIANITITDEYNEDKPEPRFIRKGTYDGKRESEIEAPTSPTKPKRERKGFRKRDYPPSPTHSPANSKGTVPQTQPQPNSKSSQIQPQIPNSVEKPPIDIGIAKVDESDKNTVNQPKTLNLNDNNENNENNNNQRQKRTSERRSSKRRSHRQSAHPRSRVGSRLGDEDDENPEPDYGNFVQDKEPSLTMTIDVEAWMTPEEGKFEECEIRFDEDDLTGGKKPPAADFRNLKQFFQFFFDRFHHKGRLLLDSNLPTYYEWKAQRKVRIRNQALKVIDHCLKACNECTQGLKAMAYNSVLLCYDEGQNETVNYAGCEAPKIEPCDFTTGFYSIVSSWDLFELGASPSNDDWRRALNSDCVAQFLCHAQPDLRHFDKEQRKEQYTFQIYKKYQLYCLSEHMNLHIQQTPFGSAMEWKKIRSQFMNKCDKTILNAIDQYTYYLNPKVDDLSNILGDSIASVTSKRKVLCEPILWLIYVVYYLLDRQALLQQLFLHSANYQDNNTKVKGQKLKTMIDNLGKQAKEESDRLRNLMARLPSLDDLQKTFEVEINERDPNKSSLYTKSFKKNYVTLSKQSMVNHSKKR